MRVLVVDDSAMERMLLRAAVEHFGHTCDEAVDGNDAWSQLDQPDYDVILTDWLMPDLGGLELCARIRARAERPYVFMVVCTALNERARGLDAVHPGADHFLTKPVDPISLQMCLITAARVMTMHRQLAEQHDRLLDLSDMLAERARTDQLTGLANRRRLDDDLDHLVGLAARNKQQLCVAMCDVDRFKAYNDRFGHPAGDEILKSVASLLAATSRETDTVYRYGGEEFLAIFPQQPMASALVAAERLRHAVEAAAMPHLENVPHGVVTVSIGLAALPPTTAPDPAALLQAADQALYRAKHAGRNRVVVQTDLISVN